MKTRCICALYNYIGTMMYQCQLSKQIEHYGPSRYNTMDQAYITLWTKQI